MRLEEADARTRLGAQDHGTLCTVHARRGVDAVPAVYAVAEGCLAVPVDRVKPKADGRLQRERNLEADPRAVLLVEHWDREDWTRLWWVRAELRCEPGSCGAVSERSDALWRGRLAQRFVQYREEESIARVLRFRIESVTGWSASAR
jgi:hypothetical protein